MHCLSPFYLLLENAEQAVLAYPVAKDGFGPFWTDHGELDRMRCTAWDEEPVLVVPLGAKRYRVAERCYGPFSFFRLHWGDEFMAEELGDGRLAMTSVCLPQVHAHFRFIASGRFDNDHPLVRHLHAMGGGWESVAGGLLTLSVAVEHAAELRRLMFEEQLAPGVLRLK